MTSEDKCINLLKQIAMLKDERQGQRIIDAIEGRPPDENYYAEVSRKMAVYDAKILAILQKGRN
ncbi:hypothetical protein D0469_03520 [Peribacillus saganii]|uniref:Uncharacterized protein n=1 Tax=Peribacillus saganii TaxID=2303992 RepID=A0A372LT99_9BACI|nr:hypothetical protein [Peribacillus saganii]RFU71022.1 hypothetical protein D0469_03520 [Peribacillus saganii]